MGGGTCLTRKSSFPAYYKNRENEDFHGNGSFDIRVTFYFLNLISPLNSNGTNVIKSYLSPEIFTVAKLKFIC